MTAATGIQDALMRIYRLEGDPEDADKLPLSVSAPLATSVKKVWPYRPSGKDVIITTPCFVNSWFVREAEYGSAITTVKYAVHASLVCFDSNSDRTAKIAASFMQPIVERFAGQIKLSGLREWFLERVRFEGSQPVVFQDISDDAGKTLIGLDFFIDITHSYKSDNAGGARPSWATD